MTKLTKLRGTDNMKIIKLTIEGSLSRRLVVIRHLGVKKLN